jgi:hypothetical protein
MCDSNPFIKFAGKTESENGGRNHRGWGTLVRMIVYVCLRIFTCIQINRDAGTQQVSATVTVEQTAVTASEEAAVAVEAVTTEVCLSVCLSVCLCGWVGVCVFSCD